MQIAGNSLHQSPPQVIFKGNPDSHLTFFLRSGLPDPLANQTSSLRNKYNVLNLSFQGSVYPQFDRLPPHTQVFHATYCQCKLVTMSMFFVFSFPSKFCTYSCFFRNHLLRYGCFEHNGFSRHILSRTSLRYSNSSIAYSRNI